MLVTNSTIKVKGQKALNQLRATDAKRKSIGGSLADVPAGSIEFTDEICSVPYTDTRTGEQSEYDAIIVKASDNKLYAVAFNALREKEPIVSSVDGKTIPCPNFGEFDESFESLYNKVKGKKSTLVKVKGLRKSIKYGTFYKGRFEYFTPLQP